MKKLKTSVLTISLLAALTLPALAQTKIATVDMRKLFDNYYKTKLAQAAIQDNSDQLAKVEKGMKDKLQKASNEYQQLLAQENDPAISADERVRRQQAATDKLKEVNQDQADLGQYDQTAQANLSSQLQRMSAKILAAIQAQVASVATAGGYTIVLNTAAERINLGTAHFDVPSAVVYGVNEIDLTAEVLKQLNAGAPIDLPASNATPATSPTPPLLSTNSP
jgi:outer membrane protein